MSRPQDRVAEAVAAHGLWSADDRVAVAVSGGLDSVVLLHLLLATAGRHRARLSVVTVDHGTRAGSAADADFVEALARELGLPSTRAALALGEGASEARCRDARYAVLDALDVERVALAHHLDDQAETVLIRMLRGAGAAGLSGMAWRRGRYVRPLLGLRREELVAFAVSRGLSWREDPSNADPRFLRNRVRGELLPLIEDLRPGATGALVRTARHAAADEAFLDGLVERSLSALGAPPGALPTAWVAEAPEPLVRRALLRLHRGLSAAHLDAILVAARRGGGVVYLSEDVQVRIDKEDVRTVTSAT